MQQIPMSIHMEIATFSSVGIVDTENHGAGAVRADPAERSVMALKLGKTPIDFAPAC
jgi:hypothetical protein